MQRKRRIKYSELEKKLKLFGCQLSENGKRHPIWISPITGLKFAMSYHKSEEVAEGTLRDILKKAGVKL
ncbi:MAG: type II toxin-antitoxin system HicA family toxin [Tannerella sp.]|nr:type II toxin-antitoxin system HicA family toxin [Tannerella sp.]